MARFYFHICLWRPPVWIAVVALLCVSCRDETATPGTSHTRPLSSETESPSTPGDVDSGQNERSLVSPPVIPKLLLSSQERSDGWIQLFDGQTLFGWKANNDVNWSVSDGVIHADTGKPGLLVTTVPFDDYELRCDFRLEPGGNSGIFLRTAFQPKDPRQDCYELNICDSHDTFPTGSFVGRQRIETPVASEGEWRTYHVRVDGWRFVVQLDGQQIMDFQDQSDAQRHSGFIGLQKNVGKIEFRNVFIRPLGTQSLFNGQDLNGWHIVPGSRSTFDVADATIHLKNGPGFLETDTSWDDFVFQFDAITNGDQLNSGVFFRAMLGTEEAPSNGYEVQIHNGFKAGDRAKPVDSGTGAIFRRTPARWVVPNDRGWFTVTLAAHGAHFATWVNGLQVTDWTDDRDPDENPRRGKRLKSGHLSLQGHDATTNLAFRNLRIVRLRQP